MDKAAYELGKQAAKLIARSVRIRLSKPGAGKRMQDALSSKKHHNSSSPWHKGRKVKR